MLIKAGGFPGSFLIPGPRGVSLGIGGFIKSLFFHDTAAEGRETVFLPALLGAIRRDDEDGNTSLSAEVSRVSFDARAKSGEGQVRGYIEFDFTGDLFKWRHGYFVWGGPWGGSAGRQELVDVHGPVDHARRARRADRQRRHLRTTGAVPVLARMRPFGRDMPTAVWSFILLALAAWPQPALAQSKPWNVLVIEAGAAGRPASTEMTEALTEELAATPSARPLTLYFEWLDLDRFRGDGFEDEVKAFLARKYRRHPPDLVVAVGDATIRLVTDWSRTLWPDVAVVVAASTETAATTARRETGATGVIARMDVNIDNSLKAALTVFPDTEHVALVAAGDVNLPLAEQALRALPEGIRVIRLVDLTIDEIRARVATLPERTVILYSGVTLDRAGQGFVARTVLEQIAPIANRPIFGYIGTLLGRGIVGGALSQPGPTMHEVAGLVARVLSGTATTEIPIVTRPAGEVAFDARELRRWGIDESRLPAGSEVRFRERNLLREYRGTLTAIAAVLAVQTVSILALVFEVRRRREAQAQQRRLSMRVLSAQEEERGRIAQELHDGASQQLALLAIELDQLGADPAVRARPVASGRALADRVRSLSSELHGLAYDLHPAILDRLGLVPALQQFAAEFAARHGIRVDVGESNWPTPLPAGIELALYRVTQEALQNVAKHSGATSATVSLVGTPIHLTLTISDTGRGFAVDAPRGGELGLAGMTERVAHIGGWLTVQSPPGRGTTLTATVSRDTVKLMETDEKLAPRG